MSELISYKKGSSIHIKPENKGKFTATKKETGKSTEELTHSKNPVTKKRLVFLQNAKKWKHQDGGNIAQYQQGGPTPMVNDNTFVYRANKPNLRGPQTSTPNFLQNANIMKALPSLAWEKLNVDLPFNALNSLARLGEKVGMTPNKALWPTSPDGIKLTPAQYQKSLLTNMQEKRWDAIKEDKYLGQPRVSWRYKNGGGIILYQQGAKVLSGPTIYSRMDPRFQMYMDSLTKQFDTLKTNVASGYNKNIMTPTRPIQFQNSAPIMSRTDIGYDNQPLPTGHFKDQLTFAKKKIALPQINNKRPDPALLVKNQKGGLINYKTK